MTEQPRIPEPLKAYGPDGEIVALSYDGGETWSKVPRDPEPVWSREYNRKVVGIVDPDDIWSARRMIPLLSELTRTEVYPSWGPAHEVLPVVDDYDGVVVSASLMTKSLIADLRSLSRRKTHPKIIVDIPAPSSDRVMALMTDILHVADGVLVPTDRIAMQMRRLHPQVFVVPPALEAPLRPVKKEPHQGLVIAVQETQAPGVGVALAYIKEKYGEKVTIIDDQWLSRHPNDDRDFYATVDILVAGPPRWSEHVTAAAVLPAMAQAVCCVADRAYVRVVRDGVTGKVVARADQASWRRALVSVLEDARLRVHLQKGARSTAQRNTTATLLGQLVRPFRLLLPPRESFRFDLRLVG